MEPILPREPPARRAESRNESYVPDILALVPSSAQNVLHVGCGTGELGQALKARQPAQVVGIELNAEAARQAKDRLDEVTVGDVEALEPPFSPNAFEVVICTGVLERARDPLRLLRRIREWLRPDGRLIAAVPNARHHRIVRSLLDGHWTCQPSGPLQNNHVRLFTRREVEKLFYRAGYALIERAAVLDSGYDESHKQGALRQVQIGRLQIGGLPPEEAEEFYAAQYLLSASPRPLPDYGLTSIVIVTHNQLSYTRACVESIRYFTDEPYELVFVDNGSADGTVEYLRSLPDAKVIVNAENCGFPAAANQGIQASSGQQILLLNNDCLVTTGWLERMLRALYSDPVIGLVGPCSNFASGAQVVPAGYDDLLELDGFAWDWGQAHRGRLVDTYRLVGFCLLIRREVVDKIGLLDEQYGVGCFEDDDYTVRALHAGYRAVMAREAFVHHFGGRTFVKSVKKFSALMQKNWNFFCEKWGLDPASAFRAVSGLKEPVTRESPPPPPPKTSAGTASRPAAYPLHLSLCMIARDSARTIRAALESIRPWVDEMIVVDTGSVDDTPAIAEKLGARVFHFPWCDDFSAARNESIRHARGRWVFWMDSDDTMDAANGRKLRELVLREAPPSLMGYVMQVHCPGAGEEGQSDVTVVDHVKLFRNLPPLRFEGRIHEQIMPAIRRAGGEVAWTDIFVVHSGYDHSPEGQKKKRERDFRILELELRDRPDHPFALFNLGMTYADVKEHEKAVEMLERSIRVSDPGESHVRKAYALLVSSYQALGRMQDAWEACQRGRRVFPNDTELSFREAVLHQLFGRRKEAEAAYRRALEDGEDRHFASVDRGIRGFKTRQNLAALYMEGADWASAEREWLRVVEEAPRYRPGWRGLMEVLLRQGKMQEAAAVADRILADPALQKEGRLLKAQIAGACGNRDAARQELERAVADSGEDLEPLRVLCRFLFEHGQPPEAEKALEELVRRDPNDGSTHHNLGTVYLRMGRHEEAIRAYREALVHRPDWPPTYLYLGQALKQSGQLDEAIAAWETALRLAPGDAQVAEALRLAKAAHVVRNEKGGAAAL